MLFLRSLATAAALAAGTLAFTMPAGLSDGSYVAYLNDAGTEVFEPFTPALARRLNIQYNLTTEEGLELTRRDAARRSNNHNDKSSGAELEDRASSIWFTWCGCGFNLDHANTDRAVQGIKDQCGGGCQIRHDLAWFTIAGDVVAFLCNGGPATRDRITKAAQKITDKCGWYVAGTALLEEGLFTELDIGYMRWFPGLDFCAAAEGSSKSSCP